MGYGECNYLINNAFALLGRIGTIVLFPSSRTGERELLRMCRNANITQHRDVFAF